MALFSLKYSALEQSRLKTAMMLKKKKTLIYFYSICNSRGKKKPRAADIKAQ